MLEPSDARYFITRFLQRLRRHITQDLSREGRIIRLQILIRPLKGTVGNRVTRLQPQGEPANPPFGRTMSEYVSLYVAL